jgi:dimethylglycine dehydrogenase
MRTQARVVVVGGGVVGVSTLYHLVKKGLTDSVLVERKELTSGSTWHAAGLLPLFNISYSVGQIHTYSVALYKRLGAETGLDVGLAQVSNIRLARTQDRLDEYRYYAGVAATIGGVEVKFLNPQQLKEIWPLCETDGILGAIQHPQDGYIQPADLTQALARGARNGGGEINRNTVVTAIERTSGGEWKVVTDKGDIICEHVVSATGNFARQTGRMVGINVPVIPVQHQYIVTEPHPAILERKAKGLPEMGVLRESDSSWYMREEAGGLLLGPYEVGAPACYVDGPSAQSEYELFQEDLDRLTPYIETAIARVPAFGEVGIKKVYNGAIAYTPDGSPIVGPAPGIPLGSPPPAARGGSWRNGSPTASRPSICLASIRDGSGPMLKPAFSSRRMKKPMPKCSPFIIRTRSALGLGLCGKPPVMAVCATSVRCSGRFTDGSGRTGSPRSIIR